MLTPRRGVTLAELLVAIVLCGILLTGIGALSARQQRFGRDIVVAVERVQESSLGAAVVPVAIRPVSPSAGDLSAATDTALEFRATIGSAVVCDTAGATMTLTRPTTIPPALASILTRPESGDTAWVLSTTGADVWTPRRIIGVSDSTFACRIGGVVQWLSEPTRPSLVLRVSPSTGVEPGSPVRITRPWRFSLYKASDGLWYLGARDWNTTSAKFNTIQPVSGPYLSAAKRGLVWRYYDSTLTSLGTGPDPRRISVIEMTVRPDSALVGAFSHPVSVRATVVGMTSLRNRP
jgi:prepilin-type N-terminal cleavage/methylation domain-containing protein